MINLDNFYFDETIRSDWDYVTWHHIGSCDIDQGWIRHPCRKVGRDLETFGQSHLTLAHRWWLIIYDSAKMRVLNHRGWPSLRYEDYSVDAESICLIKISMNWSEYIMMSVRRSTTREKIKMKIFKGKILRGRHIRACGMLQCNFLKIEKME